MRRVIVAISVALAVAGGIVGVTLASNWGNFTAGGDSEVTISMFSLTSAIHDAYHWNDDNNIYPTEVDSLNYHESSTREIEVYDDFYGAPGPSGTYVCTDWDGINLRCNKGKVEINLSVIGDPPTQSVGRWINCHEMGHAVGLTHSTDSSSCIHGTIYDSSTTLTSHDTDHLDDNY